MKEFLVKYSAEVILVTIVLVMGIILFTGSSTKSVDIKVSPELPTIPTDLGCGE